MRLANIWGKGQSFALSALDGQSSNQRDFVGLLSGDRLGIRFESGVRRELAVVKLRGNRLNYELVSSDCIKCLMSDGSDAMFIYHSHNLIVGRRGTGNVVKVFTDGDVNEYAYDDNTTVQDTYNGEFTALAVEGAQFAFAYGQTAEEAAELAKSGLKVDLDALYEKRLSYYREHVIDDPEYDQLYCKCMSAMKTELYAPEGDFPYIWSTPDRVPHRFLWLWDSVFHGIGYMHLLPDVAQQLILSIFIKQHADGMISHEVSHDRASSIIQPTVIAWGSWKVYQVTKDKQFLRTVYDANKRFLEWVLKNRQEGDSMLFRWVTTDDPNCRCDECGLDNTPRYDEERLMYAFDFSCYMANDMRWMAKIAEELGEDPAPYMENFERIVRAANETLWDEKTGYYYDRDIETGEFITCPTNCGLLALFGGIATPERAERLVRDWLENPNEFATPNPIPTLARSDEGYCKDMWRGPTWINLTYFVAEGLEDCGYLKEATALRRRSVEMVKEWYEKTGCIFEFYDAENEVSPYNLDRKGKAFEPRDHRMKLHAIPDFGWSCTLTLDMIHKLIEK